MSRDPRIRIAAGVLAALSVLSACGGGSGDGAQGATEETAGLAAVQAQHLCSVASTNFASEEDIKTELVALLDASGHTYASWKKWHDSLVDSPARAEQLAAATSEGCS